MLPFPRGRSDAACRVVIPLYAVPIDARDGVNDGRHRIIISSFAVPVYALMRINDGRWQCPAMPTVGAGSSQREDSPAHCPIKITPLQAFRRGSLLEYGGLNRFSLFQKDVATRRAASLFGLHASHLWGSMVFIVKRCP